MMMENHILYIFHLHGWKNIVIIVLFINLGLDTINVGVIYPNNFYLKYRIIPTIASGDIFGIRLITYLNISIKNEEDYYDSIVNMHNLYNISLFIISVRYLFYINLEF